MDAMSSALVPSAAPDAVDVRSPVDQRQRRIRVAFSCGEQQRREAAVGPDEIREAERLRLLQQVRLDGRRASAAAARRGARLR